MASHAAADDDQTLRADNFVKAVTVRVPSTPRKLRDDDDDGGDSTCCSARSSRAELASNFKRSVAPARVMFYESGSWTNFPGRVVELLRSGFFERKAVLHLEIEGSTYLFDFARMLQIDSGTGSQRSIAWIDDNGKCFFPRRFVSDELGCGGSDSPKIEIEIRVDVSGRNSGKRKREDEVGEEENEVTSFKRQSQPQSSSETWPNVKLLREGERAYTAVSNFFLKGIRRIDPAATISAIRQCVRSGPLDKARLEVFQKQIEITKAARGSANVVHAWYGASSRDIQGILTHGFGLPSKVSGSHGVGLYLSHLSLPFSSGLLQPDDNGEKHVLLCRVILGNVEKVEAGSQQCYPSSMEFDTGVDDPRTPTRYVVWSTNMNRHVLPECVVSYKPSDHVPGSLPRKYHVSELISRVRNSLPPSKVQQLSNLVNGLKAGKLARNDFCRQFRLVVGEQLLRSAIPEMRGSEQEKHKKARPFSRPSDPKKTRPKFPFPATKRRQTTGVWFVSSAPIYFWSQFSRATTDGDGVKPESLVSFWEFNLGIPLAWSLLQCLHHALDKEVSFGGGGSESSGVQEAATRIRRDHQLAGSRFGSEIGTEETEN